MGAPYITPTDQVECRGWVKVDDVWLSREPLYDRSTGLYARLTYAGAVAACAALGAEMVTPDDIQRLHDDAAAGLAVELAPFTLPTVDMVRAAGYAGPLNEAYQDAAQTLRTAEMGGQAWAQTHDDHVRDALTKAGWDGAARVAGAGKHWCRIDDASPPPGRAYLMGWWDGHHWIQPRPAPHSVGPHGANDQHDYGTTTLAKTSVDPGGDADPGAGAPG